VPKNVSTELLVHKDASVALVYTSRQGSLKAIVDHMLGACELRRRRVDLRRMLLGEDAVRSERA